ncbi:MAG: CcmD family protein [Flammeovirgaceae bacterium]
MNWKKLIANSLVLPLSLGAFAQTQEVPMADGMRAEGKIYVVVAIVLVILFGLIGYLVFLDRKLTRLEKRLPQ